MAGSVPALTRGIKIFRLLEGKGDLSLDEVTVQTGYPKASVLRLCEGLVELGMVSRDPQTKRYASEMRLMPKGAGEDFQTRLKAVLAGLAEETGVAAEWYVCGNEGMSMIERAQSPEAMVQIRAQVGFCRRWGAELDCVAMLGYAFGKAPKVSDDLTVYSPKGVRTQLTAAGATKRIRAAARAGGVVDANYNALGVRRMAVAVREGEFLLGVLSLAIHFTPDERSLEKARYRLLQEAAEELIG
ncbi:MAG: helix-turn-helix domain-containing protein [Planctomycetota bacterium]|jgi:IclR family pca regulon transcriptional regulator